MATGDRKDPYLGLNFLVTVGGAQASFSECTGLQAEMSAFEYIEGGNNGFVHKLPGPIRHPNIVLKGGITDNPSMWTTWFNDIYQGNITRYDVSIALCDGLGNEIRSWTALAGLPVKWSGPNFQADSNTIAFESVEFAHRGVQED